MTTSSGPAVPGIDGAGLRSLLRTGRPVRLLHGGDAAAFRAAHIPGSLQLADVALAARVLRRDEDVVVYGRDAGCERSPAVVAALRAQGFARARWYAGGLADWAAGGGSVEGTDPRR